MNPGRRANVALIAVVAILVLGCAGPGADVEDDAVAGGAAGDRPGAVESDSGGEAMGGGEASGGGEARGGGEGGAGGEVDGRSPVCLRGGPFVADGGVATGASSSGDPHRVGGIRWQRHDGCERLVVDLAGADGGAAGGAGAVTAEVLRGLGVVRIALRDVEGIDPDATDATFAGPLARAAYSVIAPEGRHVYVDVHLGDAAEAGVSTLGDPARVVVDLRPGGGPVPGPAPSHRRVVVLEPRPGPATYPLTVTGYARTFEANVVVRLERAGEDAYDDFTTASAWAEGWGHYSFTIPDGPSGSVVLHVGEHSARDGSWEGVAVPLELRR